MKLIRFGEIGKEKPGVLLENGKKIDVSAAFKDFDEDFYVNNGLAKLKDWVAANSNTAPEVAHSVRLGSCVAKPGKIICIGLNYRKHAEESGMGVPTEPVVFFKASSALNGPNDVVIIPKNSKKTDWEVELAIVIGKRANYVSEAEALDYVAGYCVHNDYSEREFQLERGGQWVKGKSCDTFAPLGPWMVTADEIKNPNDLKLWLKVDGHQHQNGSTNDFIFNCQHVISYLSQFMSLMPGDVISTGTPEGVGFGYKPPIYLKGGEKVELGIEGLGTQSQTIATYKA